MAQVANFADIIQVLLPLFSAFILQWRWGMLLTDY